MARLAKGLNEPLIAAAGVAPGHQVLDIASGVGEPALSMAKLVGPDGRVTATDLVANMLAGAERRAREKGRPKSAFKVRPWETLPFAAAAFDAGPSPLGGVTPPSPERPPAPAGR
ncbi:MAG: methyltransferase domain-containing protein, partial [Alphaproteobacteria bacterium]|nr:methyltransferase domain-containing protein [Alphaproteobacteria bacterium]